MATPMAAMAATTVAAASAVAGTPADKRVRSPRERFPDFWFSFAGMPYAIERPHVIDRATVADLRDAAAAAAHVFSTVAPIVAALPDERLAEIGIPANVARLCRKRDALDPTFLGRFDFALTKDGPKLLEFNADTPFFIWESFEIAGAIATYCGLDDPNAGMLEIFYDEIERCFPTCVPGTERIAVTAFNTTREDWFTARTMARYIDTALDRRVEVVPLSDLRVDARGIRDRSGQRIDVLWRHYGLESFACDPAGDSFVEHVLAGNVRIVNPPASLLVQNKAAQAIVWGLRDTNVFDEGERAAIDRIFLPTFLDLPGDGDRFVRKPVLGREGEGVAILDRGRRMVGSDAHRYAGQPVVYQRFVEIPSVAYEHPTLGATSGHAIATCFVVAGRPSAVAMRVGGVVTDRSAMMLPLAYAI